MFIKKGNLWHGKLHLEVELKEFTILRIIQVIFLRLNLENFYFYLMLNIKLQEIRKKLIGKLFSKKFTNNKS